MLTGAMLAINRGFNHKLFSDIHFPKTLARSFLFPRMAASPTVSSPAYSTGSPYQDPPKRVGTHNGSFHCDEALGCFMIRLTNKFSNAEIVRSRDPQVSISLILFLFHCKFATAALMVRLHIHIGDYWNPYDEGFHSLDGLVLTERKKKSHLCSFAVCDEMHANFRPS